MSSLVWASASFFALVNLFMIGLQHFAVAMYIGSEGRYVPAVDYNLCISEGESFNEITVSVCDRALSNFACFCQIIVQAGILSR